jgi:hypothetical protein
MIHALAGWAFDIATILAIVICMGRSDDERSEKL